MSPLKQIYLTSLVIFGFATIYAQPTRLTYTGSSTIGNFIQVANGTYGKVNFSLDVEPESVGGELAIIEGRTDLAGRAKLPGTGIQGAGIESTLIGWDAIAVIVHQSNAIQNLTQTQLKEIFTGKITNWNEVGGADLPIQPYIVSIESATRKVFRSKILAEENYRDCEVVTPDVDIISKVKNNPGAIGTISYSFLHTLDNIKSLSINNQSLELTNPNYPITRPLYLLWHRNNKDIAEFIQWVNSQEGQRLVMQRFIGNRETNLAISGESGTLIVYTETEVVEDGGIYYYPHSPYDILSTDKNFIMRVTNHLSTNDENPTRVTLPHGTYIIRTDIEPLHEQFVTIQANKISKFRLEIDQENTRQSPSEEQGIDQSLNKEILDRYKFLKPYGDLRFRLEEDILDDFNRFSVRFRVRAGINASLSPSVKLDMRLGSSNDPDDPNSTHVNANDGFNQLNIVIDRAYLEINPQKFKQFSLWLGKFPHRFTSSSIFSENVWDDDIQPEGGAFSFSFKPSNIFNQIRIYNGLYVESQFSSNATEDWLNSTQFSADLALNDNIDLTLASGLYYHGNIKNHDFESDFLDNNGGNSTYFSADSSRIERYATDFHILDNFILFRFNQLPKTLLLKGNLFTIWEFHKITMDGLQG